MPFLVGLFACLLAAPASAPARAHHRGRHRDRLPRCSTSPHSWVAGSVWLCHGVLTYGDYVDDDYGADTGQSDTTSRTATLMPSAGDQSYPHGQDATADLVLLRLQVRGRRLLVSGVLNALYQPHQTVLAIAIDSDNNPRTGGGRWGNLDVSSTGWDKLALFTNGNTSSNVISGTMPLPPGKTWRVQAATAIAASGQVMNVAFRRADEQASAKGAGLNSDSGAWFEDKQAAALGRGDISQFGTVVRVRDLKRRRTQAAPNPAGLHERVYRSAYTVPPGEGVNVAGVPGRGDGGGQVHLGFEQTFQYLGRYQPYGIYIPRQPASHGVQLLFHGSSSGMSGLVNQPGMQQRFGEELNRVLVVPEARGQNGFGSDISERDLLDVMADVQANYPIDATQVFSGGYSQGGYITYRMAELYPDRFAGAVDWVGFTGDEANGSTTATHYTAGAVGNAIDYVGNLRWIPTAMLYAGADELVHVWTARAMDQAFDGTDNVFKFYLHPAAEHLTFAALDDWRKEAAYTRALRLVSNPPRVTYRTETYLDDPALGIVHDRAYWVSAIRGRQTGQVFENVDLTTLACGGSAPVLRRSGGAGLDPVPWTSDAQSIARSIPLARADRLQGSLGNVASLRVDARRACLARKHFSYSIATDGTATIKLSDGRTLTLLGAGLHTGNR